MKRSFWLALALGLAALPVLVFAQHQNFPAEPIAINFQRFAPEVKTHADERNFYVESDGFPDHPLMVGITAWQQQVPLPQRYTGQNAWQFPLRPTPAKSPLSAKTHFFRGAIAIAVDGVPIFNALNNRGVDSNLAGELDEFGGHAGRADDYHYHVAPTFLEKKVGKGHPIGYALDGYPLYSFHEPDGSAPGKLDEFNGHTTPALGYHYHATKTYPYLNGGFHGEVSEIGGQVDPQPSARSPRPATWPLPGAKITGFTRAKPENYSLAYSVNGTPCRVDYKKDADGGYTFTYQTSVGTTFTQVYPQRGGGRGQGQGQERLDPRIARPTDFQLVSPAVANGGSLPALFTCDGGSASPPVAWKNAPKGTKSFALIMHHFPPGEEEAPHVYWIAYNIAPTVREIPQNDRAIGLRGGNTVNRRIEYAPPCSQGPGKKWYTLTLYALSEDLTLDRSRGVTRDAVLQAMAGKILNSSAMNVSYERQ